MLASQQIAIHRSQTIVMDMRIPTLLCVLVFLCVGPTTTCNLFGQQPSQQLLQDGQRPPEIKPKTEEFKKALAELRAHLAKLNATVVRFNTGETSEDRKYRKQWNDQIEAGIPLFHAMLQAALAEFKQDPAKNVEIANLLYYVAKQEIEGDRPEGMLDIVEALLEFDYPDPELRNFHTVAAFAVNEYDRCYESLKLLVDSQRASEQLAMMFEKFEDNIALWEQELEYRKQDAEGEPLPKVLIKTTKGDIELELFENNAPETVGNFISLVESGFYENQTFHRVMQHFMAQTGCPNGDGTGSAGYTVYGEMNKPNARNFFRGTVGLALATNTQTGQTLPNSGGSQFFFSVLPSYTLNGKYTAFGRITKGLHVLGLLAKIDPDEKKEKKDEDKKVMPDEIISIEVLSKRDHEYKPNKVSDGGVFGGIVPADTGN